MSEQNQQGPKKSHQFVHHLWAQAHSSAVTGEEQPPCRSMEPCRLETAARLGTFPMADEGSCRSCGMKRQEAEEGRRKRPKKFDTRSREISAGCQGVSG